MKNLINQKNSILKRIIFKIKINVSKIFQTNFLAKALIE